LTLFWTLPPGIITRLVKLSTDCYSQARTRRQKSRKFSRKNKKSKKRSLKLY
jgi:hypothetical protein